MKECEHKVGFASFTSVTLNQVVTTPSIHNINTCTFRYQTISGAAVLQVFLIIENLIILYGDTCCLLRLGFLSKVLESLVFAGFLVCS